MNDDANFDFDFEDFDSTEVQGGSRFIDKPGTYHVQIEEVKVGVGPKGNPVNGFTVEFSVLAGTEGDQVGRLFNDTIFSPKPDASEGARRFSQAKIAAFLLAANLISEDQFGKRGKVDLASARGMQCFISLEIDKHSSTDEKQYLRVAGTHITHVDDPRAAGFPRDAEAIGMIPNEHRREPAFFERYKKAGGKGKPVNAPPQRNAGADFSDL